MKCVFFIKFQDRNFLVSPVVPPQFKAWNKDSIWIWPKTNSIHLWTPWLNSRSIPSRQNSTMASNTSLMASCDSDEMATYEKQRQNWKIRAHFLKIGLIENGPFSTTYSCLKNQPIHTKIHVPLSLHKLELSWSQLGCLQICQICVAKWSLFLDWEMEGVIARKEFLDLQNDIQTASILWIHSTTYHWSSIVFNCPPFPNNIFF